MGDWDIILLTILTLMSDWDIILLTISIQYQANRWWGQRKPRSSNPYSSIQENQNQKIKKTEQIKLLGSYIKEYLNFAGHISNLSTQSNQKVGVLVYGCNLIPCNTKLTLYKSAILSHLTYWLLVWNFCKSYNSRKIVQVQEGALQAIYIYQRWKHTKNSSLMLGYWL